MKKTIKVVAVMGILVSLFSLFGCKNEINHSFASMSQEDKQAYVTDYMQSNYHLSCDLTEIKQKPLDSFGYKNEDEYYTVASVDNDSFRISIWIAADGTVTDTAFTYDMRDSVNSYIEALLLANGISGTVKDRFIFEAPSQKEWTGDEVQAMLEQENISHNIHLYTDSSTVNHDAVHDALQSLNGAVYIHFTQTDFNTWDDFIDLD